MDPNHPTNTLHAGAFHMGSSGIEHGTSHTSPGVLSFHKLLPVAVLYFFLNSVGLPTGLFYTTLLSPLLFIWLYLQGKRWITLKFLLCLSPFIVMHIHDGLDSSFYYARSVLLFWTVLVTVYSFCWALLKCKNIERLFEQLIVLNFCAALFALPFLFTPLKGVLWSLDFADLGGDGGWAPRLMLLSSEPSVYGHLMAPLLIFAVLRLFRDPVRRNFIYAAIIVIPLLLSQSFGALSMCTAGLGVALFPRFRRLLKRKSSILILGLGTILVAGVILVPNPISRRVFQVAGGTDSSARFRTEYSFIEAYGIAESKSLWWGVGFGQVKLYTGYRLVRSLGFLTAVIPNSTADTFANLGIFGVLVKFILEIYLFFRTRVYSSTFRLAMFVYAFLLQLTGSSIMDVQEYLLWCFAFAPFFPWLNLQNGVPAPARLKAS